MSLESWGWDDEWASEFNRLSLDTAEPGRVVGQDRDRWSVQTQLGGVIARVASRTRLDPYPVVGDWVAVEPGGTNSDPFSLLSVLPRRFAISRGTAGSGAFEQVLAANMDTVWVVHGLDAPVNLRRLERYLAVAWESGALPTVVLTKSDLAEDLEESVAGVERVAFGVSVRTVSIQDRGSVEELRSSLIPGQTVVLLGPSGVGKSTLVNQLSQRSVTATGSVRTSDRKGRHTTTRRELFQIEGGGLVLDSPGLRELRVWKLGEGLDQAFPDIDQLARACRFRDCGHETEPDCAVQQAITDGRLDASRLASYHKLLHEARRMDHRVKAEAVSKHKTALKTLKYHPKYRDRK